MWINLDLESVSYLSIANEKNDNVRNVEKMPVGAEKVPIDNLSTQQRIIFQFVKENGRNIAFASCFIKL